MPGLTCKRQRHDAESVAVLVFVAMKDTKIRIGPKRLLMCNDRVVGGFKARRDDLLVIPRTGRRSAAGPSRQKKQGDQPGRRGLGCRRREGSSAVVAIVAVVVDHEMLQHLYDNVKMAEPKSQWRNLLLWKNLHRERDESKSVMV